MPRKAPETGKGANFFSQMHEGPNSQRLLSFTSDLEEEKRTGAEYT